MKILATREILFAVSVMAEVLAINPYKLKNGHLVYSKLKLLQMFLSQMTCITCIIFFFKKYTNQDVGMTKVISFIVMLRSFGWYFLMIAMLTITFLNYPRFIFAIKTISEVDLVLIELGQEETIRKFSYEHRNLCTVLIVMDVLMLTICSEVHSAWIRNYDIPLFIMVFIYPKAVCIHFLVVFMVLLKVIQTRFGIINNKLAKSQFSTNDDLEKLVFCHVILCKITRDLKSIFATELLLAIAFYYVLSLSDIHTGFHIVLFNITNVPLLVASQKSFANGLFNVIYLCKRCQDLCFEVNSILMVQVLVTIFLG